MRQFFEQFLIGEDLEELAHIFYVRVLINRCQCKNTRASFSRSSGSNITGCSNRTKKLQSETHRATLS